MKRLHSIEDDRKGLETYQLSNGQWITLDKREIETYGLNEVMRRHGLVDQLPSGRLPVLHCGQMIGTLPESFDPSAVASLSKLYSPRVGDFRRNGATIVASDSLGLGDIEAVPNFRPA